MTWTLYIGDYAYSSWSLRGWLLFEAFGIPATLKCVDFKAATVAEQMAVLPPAKTVPTAVSPEGTVIWDSLALAEELATRFPDAGLWPEDAAARATARALAAEMHSSFSALRSACPMYVRTSYDGFVPSDAVNAALARIDEIWAFSRSRFGADGPWLTGRYSVADAFYAPVAARVAGFKLPVSEASKAYVEAHLNDGAFRRWRAQGLVLGAELRRYAQELEMADWPGPQSGGAEAIEDGTPVNDVCPYSGKSPTHLLRYQGKVYGFCNAGCRDKTVADPEVWPDFMALVAKS
jgi:glutathione S-transferase